MYYKYLKLSKKSKRKGEKTEDSKSAGGNPVRVQIPPPALKNPSL